jgi:hypothetical protein
MLRHLPKKYSAIRGGRWLLGACIRMQAIYGFNMNGRLSAGLHRGRYEVLLHLLRPDAYRRANDRLLSQH